jgi:hypothetical protein
MVSVFNGAEEMYGKGRLFSHFGSMSERPADGGRGGLDSDQLLWLVSANPHLFTLWCNYDTMKIEFIR